MSQIRAATLLSAFFLATLVIAIPVQALLRLLRLRASHTFPYLYFKWLCRVLGIRIETHGTMVSEGPLLIAANHTSYFDIPVLGALGPVAFIAKTEVKRWPFFGLCADLNRTIFVDRNNRARAIYDRNQIQARLRQGDRLVLFPEGTSSDGNGILPFKSALLSVAELDLTDDERRKGRPFRCRVQPVSITYTRLNGLPMGRIKRPLFAWYGDMDLMPHLWGALAAGPFDVVVEFHPPVTAEQLGDRKALARYCEDVVRAGVIKALSGRQSAPWIAFGGTSEAVHETAPTPQNA
ncbi:MAG TPA: lysophospholipid acyltransferase family protein [Alphaproteobacteria bacterium]|nr:lysophospholipid acyltransferase family protein [Alphaproteobacteria bacterium]